MLLGTIQHIEHFCFLTWAFFKAILFLCSGSTILKQKYEQYIKKVIRLFKYPLAHLYESFKESFDLEGSAFFQSFPR